MIKYCWIVLVVIFTITSGAKEVPIKKLWETSSRQSTTRTKIKSTQKDLTQTDRKQKQLNQQLSKIAKSILKAEKENRELEKVLKKLEKSREINEEKYSKATKKIDTYKGTIEVLDKTIQKQNEHFRRLLIEQFSLMTAMHQIDKKTVDSILMQEIYEAYKKQSKQELETLKQQIDHSIQKKKKVLGYQKKIEKSISEITQKRETYIRKKREKEKLLKKLIADEIAYRKSIKELMKKQSMIRATLAKLNIIRKEEIAKEKALEQARQKEIDRRASVRNSARKNGTQEHMTAQSFSNNQNVKQVGSSYHRNKIYRYRGIKTISPLKGAKVVKSFGTYIDPLYKMKIFNESITLKAPKQNAKVRNVLNGKVVFSGENSMLGKMIVIAHGNGLHTIYAGLSRISPEIHRGVRVKKKTVIGKVKRKLIFEATKNSKYINPLRLIKL